MVCNSIRNIFCCICQDQPNSKKENELSLLPEEKMDVKELFVLPERSKELESRNAALKVMIQAFAKLPRKKSQAVDKSSVVELIYQGNRAACHEWFVESLEMPWKKSIVISVIKTEEFVDEGEFLNKIKELQNLIWLHINVEDNASAWSGEEGIKKNLCQAFKLIDQSRIEGTELLVHCLGGQSRSSTLLACYLMWSTGLPFQDVTIFMISRRNFAGPTGTLREAFFNDFPLINKGRPFPTDPPPSL